jgi:hypothetical protein
MKNSRREGITGSDSELKPGKKHRIGEELDVNGTSPVETGDG